MKNMGLKKSFLILSASCVLLALLLLGQIFLICNLISKTFPTGGVEILSDGSIVNLETPTASQQRILRMLNIIQIVSCIILPMGGLALSGVLYYHIKLKQPIAALRNGITRVQNHNLDFSMPVHSDDELGQLCAAFDTMREELLKSNQELWRQAEERKRLNAAFSHDLRNPITVLKGTVKLLRKGTADQQAIDRLESYTLRIEQYVEAMSSIQRLEQMPVRLGECSYSLLCSELEDTAKLLAGTLELSISAPDNGTTQLDHGLFLTVAENLIGNAARFAKSKIIIQLERQGNFLLLSVTDDGPGYPVELIHDRLTHLPHELSGGQQQRVAIARALIAKPDIIFADEPTGNLDSKSGGEVMGMLENIWKKMGKTLVVITHDSRIARMADRQFVIVDGVLSEVTAK